MKTTIITVNGMHCVACETLIAEVLEEMDGVNKATVSFKNGTATVAHNESVSDSQLRKAIEAEGYKTK